MKRVALFLLLPLAVACATVRVKSSGGASSPTAAILQFLDAAKRRDLAAMAQVWGTDAGSASATMSRQELERRELIMMQCLRHEKATLGVSGPGEAGRLKLPVQLTMGDRRANPSFTVVRSSGARWFVENFEMDQLRDQGFCSLPSAPAKP